MLTSFFQKRSIRQHREATNNLYTHAKNYISLRKMADDGLAMLDSSGGAFGVAQLAAIGKNIQANLAVEISGAEQLLSEIATAASVLRGHCEPTVALASVPAPLVSVAGIIVEATRNLDVLDDATGAEVAARQNDKAAILAEMQGLETDLTSIVRDLNGLQESIQRKSFTACSMSDQFNSAVDKVCEFLTTRYRNKGIYHVPSSMFGEV